MLYSYLTRCQKYIKFIAVGGLNAAIYFSILLIFIELSGDYYLSVALSQAAIAAIAYVTFSHLHFKSKLELKIFIKFSVSNILLFLASSGIVWITSGMQLRSEVFGIIVVLIIAPLSYIFNTYFVFNSGNPKENTHEKKNINSNSML